MQGTWCSTTALVHTIEVVILLQGGMKHAATSDGGPAPGFAQAAGRGLKDHMDCRTGVHASGSANGGGRQGKGGQEVDRG